MKLKDFDKMLKANKEHRNQWGKEKKEDFAEELVESLKHKRRKNE
jgi:hypothetical protein